MARPQFQPTDEQRKIVRDLAAEGTSQALIAKKLDIAATCLRKYFRAELDDGMAAAGHAGFHPTIEQRDEVSILAGRVNESIIASRIGCSVPTLLKHCRSELDTGFAHRNADMWVFLYRQAEKGNVTAIKEFERRTAMLIFGPGQQPKRSEQRPSPNLPAEAREAPLGKKEMAKLTAQHEAVGVFAVPPAPTKMN